MGPVDNEMDENKSPAARVAEFASSEMFRRLFKEGMDLVEETASYLDGPGREDAKRLGRNGALAYAAESMTLTTQLMQSASWLLVQRAVSEKDMTPSEAADDKYRLAKVRDNDAIWPTDEVCPARLQNLSTRSRSLYERLQRLDDNLFKPGTAFEGPAANPVASQINALENAFNQPR